MTSGRPRPTTPVSLIILLVAALMTGVGVAAYRYAEVWTPLQRLYLFVVCAERRGVDDQWSRTSCGTWSNRTGRRLALDEELVTVTSATGETSFALSDTAVKAGATRLVWQRESYRHAALHPSSAGGSITIRPSSTWRSRHSGAPSPSSSAGSSGRGHRTSSALARGAHGTPRARRTGRRAPAIIDYVPQHATLAGTVRGVG